MERFLKGRGKMKKSHSLHTYRYGRLYDYLCDLISFWILVIGSI